MMCCPTCRDRFKPNRKWQRFCSKECRVEWHRDRLKKAYELMKENDDEPRK